MKWILKKLIVVLVEALVVAGLLDALGIDLEGLLGGLLGEDDVVEGEGTSEEESSVEA